MCVYPRILCLNFVQNSALVVFPLLYVHLDVVVVIRELKFVIGQSSVRGIAETPDQGARPIYPD